MGWPRRLLIANRGEIACRIARTARRLNIYTIAVYSDADAGARHVAACDAAIRIGAPPADQSYLRGDAVLAAARESGADAVHPGYGFLSENAEFAAACVASGLVFVGPPAAAIRAMGSKSAAKELLGRAGVPLTPGYHGERQEAGFLEDEAARIGFPVLIKASAGGGGKGMRRVDRREEFAAALASCQREAAASFGDARVLIERYILRPRHVEIQVFADTRGHCVYLHERDCSVQRRHQKVLEEAPAPGVSPERRAALGQAAVEAARAVEYVGAGTVEFIVDPEGRFYFMEMNTRLQVEHPVTEMITGLDLVEWQLRVAAGEPLPLTQEALPLTGHALEARIYAEDPDRGFVPSIGRLLHAGFPLESRFVRVDTGFGTGDTITPYYDALLAKLIVWDESRERALARMQTALAACEVVGVTTNVAFLRRLVGSTEFQSADLDTALIERAHAQLFPAATEPPAEAWLLAAAGLLARERDNPGLSAVSNADDWPATRSPWCLSGGWRIGARAARRLALRALGHTRTVQITYRADGWELRLEANAVVASAAWLDPTTLRFSLGSRCGLATVVFDAATVHVFLGGESYRFATVDPFASANTASAAAGHLRSPMPGRVVSLLVEPGREVVKGTPLLILEAMKMEHTITAPFAGRVESFRVAAGEQIPEGVELVDLAALPGAT